MQITQRSRLTYIQRHIANFILRVSVYHVLGYSNTNIHQDFAPINYDYLNSINKFRCFA